MKMAEISTDESGRGFTHLQEAKRDMQFATEVAPTQFEGYM